MISNSSRVVKVDSEISWEFFRIQAKKLGCSVVVHFTTTWCIPSIAMNSIFEELALSYSDTLFLLVDVDEFMKLAKKMEIKAMPSFVMMKDGVEVDRVVGANPQELTKRVSNFAKPNPIVSLFNLS